MYVREAAKTLSITAVIELELGTFSSHNGPHKYRWADSRLPGLDRGKV